MPVLARHTAAVLAARLGLSRRCLVLDLDNTLWGGVIGDDGVEGITLGNGPDGEAFVDFQVAIKELSQRGIVLAVSSKNDPEVARRAVPRASRHGAEARRLRRLRRRLEPEVGGDPQHRRDARAGARRADLPRRQPLRARRGAPGASRGRRAGAARRSGRLSRHARVLRELRAGELHRGRPGARRAVPGARQGRGAARHRRLARGLPGEPRHGGADRRDRRPEPGAGGAARQQDQPVQPDHPPAQPGRARGVPGAAGGRGLLGAAQRQVRRPRPDRGGAGRGARARRWSSTPC